MMIKRRILTVLFFASSAIPGCSGGGAGSASEQSLSSMCAGGEASAKAAPDSIQIEGDQVAQTSAPASYKLNEDLGCAGNQKVEWTAQSSTSPKGFGSEYTPLFEQSGEYVVTAKITNTESGNPIEVTQKTVVVGDQASIIAPEVAMAGVNFSVDLAVPATSNPVSALWSFGDGKPVQFGLGPLTYKYASGGTYTIGVAITDASGAISNITRRIVVLAATDGFECIADMTVSGPSEAYRGQPVSWSLFLPACMTGMVHHVSWSFSDGQGAGDGTSITRSFSSIGTYTVKTEIFNDDTQFPLVTLTRQVTIKEPPVDPEDPLNCPAIGAVKDSYANQSDEEVECGILGTRKDTYHDHIVETCQGQGTSRRWVETSRTRELVQQGQCEGMYCEVPAPDVAASDVLAMGLTLKDGKYYMPHGTTLGYYTSQTPEGLCVKQNRYCDNGVLGGPASAIYLTCKNGCEGFGKDGTVKTGVSVGEESVLKVCQFGETGIQDLFSVIADQKCSNGTVETSNNRRGTLKTGGVCPTYTWTSTDKWSACSADCGGEQALIYECRDASGVAVSSERCTTEAPVQTRVCDGNPEAVRSTETVTMPEEVGSSNVCPKNQIGVISKSRDVSVVKTYACIDHSVKLESEKTQYGEWVTENYCREYVAHRCSQDSLNNSEAHGRYLWMVKCQNQVPVIKEFLANFDEVKAGGGTIDIGSTKRVLYPTFMDRSKKPEKPWLAPKKESASCDVPSTVYIAAVCLSSCATPEQQILSQPARGADLRYSTFLEALTNNHAYVATLRSESNLRSRALQKTKVEQWVTELVDTEHTILDFQFASGGKIRLTPNHPVVTDEGMLKLAEEFKVGENFVRLGGAPDKIISITETKHFGKVYNLFVQSADPMKNVVVTNGYLNGTAFYQNEGAKFLNRRVFQGRMTKGVFANEK